MTPLVKVWQKWSGFGHRLDLLAPDVGAATGTPVIPMIKETRHHKLRVLL